MLHGFTTFLLETENDRGSPELEGNFSKGCIASELNGLFAKISLREVRRECLLRFRHGAFISC